mgnify:CR=1 FL=1
MIRFFLALALSSANVVCEIANAQPAVIHNPQWITGCLGSASDSDIATEIQNRFENRYTGLCLSKVPYNSLVQEAGKRLQKISKPTVTFWFTCEASTDPRYRFLRIESMDSKMSPMTTYLSRFAAEEVSCRDRISALQGDFTGAANSNKYIAYCTTTPKNDVMLEQVVLETSGGIVAVGSRPTGGAGECAQQADIINARSRR